MSTVRGRTDVFTISNVRSSTGVFARWQLYVVGRRCLLDVNYTW